MTSTSARYSRPPFTATQWQELEHQALIYKYMSSGVPIPPDLIYTLRTSLDSRFLAQQPIGWGGCFQIGFGRKVDPEPGRCRRTDGKKWRCSKEAHQDSKYCEKHMHRGKNRSRKPVEVSSSISTTQPNISPSMSSIQGNFSTTTVTASSPYVLPSLTSSSMPTESSQSSSSSSSSYNINTQLYPFLHPHSSSSKPFGLALSPQKNTSHHHMFLDSGNSCSQDDRYFRGLDERTFLEEASGSARNCLPESYEPLNMNSYITQSELQRLSDNSGQQQQNEDEQSCFIWGTDFKSSARSMKAEKEDGTQKPLHQFLGEWPPKGTDSWL